jgi:glycosyltransferase involved in cell wall biosynthesis
MIKKFSILIPSWNNLPYLKLCVESIRRNSHFQHQLIVHINEGKDGSLDWVRGQPDIHYTYSAENIGVCYALNTGRTLVETDYIVYMNDDMYVCPGWDLELFREVEAVGHDRFFMSSTAIEPVASSICAIEKNFGTTIEDFDEAGLLENFSKFQKDDWQGATWPPNIVHKTMWDLVGGYSTEFSPGMYSDPDFSMKLWVAGVRLFKGLGKSRVYHFGSRSTTRVVKNSGYYKFISKWGITSSTLTKKYLRRGEKFDGPLSEPPRQTWVGIKNLFKRLEAAARR